MTGGRFGRRNVTSALAAACADVADAVFDYDDARGWFDSRLDTFAEPLAVEVWILDAEFRNLVLVRHPGADGFHPAGLPSRTSSLVMPPCARSTKMRA